MSQLTSTCPGCKVILPTTDYPADNRYGIFSAECRQKFDEVLVREGELFGYPSTHRLVIDSYAVQHPPHLEIQQKLNIAPRFVEASIQSISIHLIALYLAIECKKELRSIASEMDYVLSTMSAQKVSFAMLPPPDDLGALRIVDIWAVVVNGDTFLSEKEYTQLMQDWAQIAWAAWSSHHDTIRELYKKYGKN